MKTIMITDKMKRDGIGRNVYHFELQKKTKGNIQRDKSKIINRKLKYSKKREY